MKPVMAAGQTPVGPLLQAFFIDYLYGQKRASARTVESYRDTFRLLLQFLRQTTEKEPSTLHTRQCWRCYTSVGHSGQTDR